MKNMPVTCHSAAAEAITPETGPAPPHGLGCLLSLLAEKAGEDAP